MNFSEEFNLSEKRVERGGYGEDYFIETDVKEFIKRLKEKSWIANIKINGKMQEVILVSDLNELVGDKLI